MSSPRKAASGTLWVKEYWKAISTIGTGKSGPAAYVAVGIVDAFSMIWGLPHPHHDPQRDSKDSKLDIKQSV